MKANKILLPLLMITIGSFNNIFAQNANRIDANIDRNDHITIFGTTAYKMSEELIFEEIIGEYYEGEISDEPSIVISLMSRDGILYEQNVFIDFSIISDIYPELQSTSPIAFAATGYGQFINGMNYIGQKWYRGKHKEGTLYILKMNKQTLMYTDYIMKTYNGVHEKYVYDELGDGSRAIVFLHGNDGRWYYISQKLNARIVLIKAEKAKIKKTASQSKEETVAKAGCDEIKDFIDNRAVARKGNKWGVIDMTGKWVIPCIYDEEIKFKSDLAIVSIDGKWGCVRRDGVVVVNCIYDEKFSFDDNGIAKVCKDGKYGMIRENGQFILGCKYDKIGEYNRIIMQVMRDGQYGYVDKYGIEDYVQCNIIEYKKNVLTIQSSFNIANSRSTKFILIRYDNSNSDSFKHEVEHLVTMGITGGSKFVKPICALQLKSGQSTLNCTSDVLEVLDKTELAKLKKKKNDDSTYYILVRLSDEQYAAMVAKKQQTNTRERQYLNSRTGNTMQSLRGFGSYLQRATGWGF